MSSTCSMNLDISVLWILADPIVSAKVSAYCKLLTCLGLNK